MWWRVFYSMTIGGGGRSKLKYPIWGPHSICARRLLLFPIGTDRRRQFIICMFSAAFAYFPRLAVLMVLLIGMKAAMVSGVPNSIDEMPR